MNAISKTAELIARLHSWMNENGDMVGKQLISELTDALAALAQEVEWLTELNLSSFNLGYSEGVVRAEAAEARYEELKSTHIAKIEAVRAEYLGQYLSLQAALTAAEARVRELEERIAELYREEKNAFRSLKANGETIAAIEAATIERCAKVAEDQVPGFVGGLYRYRIWNEIAAAIRALKEPSP